MNKKTNETVVVPVIEVGKRRRLKMKSVVKMIIVRNLRAGVRRRGKMLLICV